VEVVRDGRIFREEVPLRNAMNEVMRDAYVEDCARGVEKWNRAIAAQEIPFRLTLPSRRFHRRIGLHVGGFSDPEGSPLTEEEWKSGRDAWLPSEADQAFVRSLMARPVLDPRQMAGWIAAPKQGIKGRPIDFEYVRRTEA
jgi:benzoyl-CoA 2,3-dioxygenase component B